MWRYRIRTLAGTDLDGFAYLEIFEIMISYIRQTRKKKLCISVS